MIQEEMLKFVFGQEVKNLGLEKVLKKYIKQINEINKEDSDKNLEANLSSIAVKLNYIKFSLILKSTVENSLKGKNDLDIIIKEFKKILDELEYENYKLGR